MKLYRYFEKGNNPYLTLSDLPDEEAQSIQDVLKESDNVYTKRDYDGKYMYYRRIVEDNVRLAFINKGGKPVRKTPLYFVLGESHETNSIAYMEWYKCPDYIEIPMNKINAATVSFTYGDSFIENHPEHRDQSKYCETVLTYEEILRVIQDSGWPQDSVKDDSPFWVPRYIEAQVWCNETMRKHD